MLTLNLPAKIKANLCRSFRPFLCGGHGAPLLFGMGWMEGVEDFFCKVYFTFWKILITFVRVKNYLQY